MVFAGVSDPLLEKILGKTKSRGVRDPCDLQVHTGA